MISVSIPDPYILIPIPFLHGTPDVSFRSLLSGPATYKDELVGCTLNSLLKASQAGRLPPVYWPGVLGPLLRSRYGGKELRRTIIYNYIYHYNNIFEFKDDYDVS